MVTYQFQVDDETWTEWKNTVPRSKSLDTRLRELIEADTEGRVQQPAETARPPEEPLGREDGPAPDPTPRTDETRQGDDDADVEASLQESLPGSGDDLDERVQAVLAMYEHLRAREGEGVKTKKLKEIGDEYAHGYANVGSFWTNCVKKNKSQDRPNALLTLPGVRQSGEGEYTYEGENNGE